MNFNSHAHVERDFFNATLNGNKRISTHTLTWSVTQRFCNWYELSRFQLTRSRGAWLVSLIKLSDLSNFNSHAHVERDLRTIVGNWLTANFNSHAHVERDQLLYGHIGVYRYFNSHAHVERDAKMIQWELQGKISTHTLTWSVTCLVELSIVVKKFQLTRSRGAWHLMLCISGACSTWCGLIFLFNGYRFDFVHCAFTNSMAFSCELTRDLWITWGTLVKILGRLQGHRSLWCRSVLLYASNCCLSNISADYHALGLLFSEVYLSLSEKCHSLRLFQTRCSALADHNFDTLSTLF